MTDIKFLWAMVQKKDLFIHSYLEMKTLNNTKGGACLLLI